MQNKKTLFYVGSEVQKGLFLQEIQGQISDGTGKIGDHMITGNSGVHLIKTA